MNDNYFTLFLIFSIITLLGYVLGLFFILNNLEYAGYYFAFIFISTSVVYTILIAGVIDYEP